VTADRVRSIDIVRGAVMVLMAIDHVRVYAGVPAGGPDPAVFFTRWVTHFCAPAFVFLAGTSVFLQGRKVERGALARRLLLRGLWIILLELTVVRVAWGFNLHFERYLLAGVLWVIGWSMIAMALLVRLPTAVVGAFGVLLIAGHNLSAFAPATMESLGESRFAWLWQILYFGGRVGPNLFVLYSIVPWVGVMAAGYAFGAVLTRDPATRRRLCLAIGLGAIVLFVVLRGLNLYGDRPWSASESPPAWLAFLNTTKYPASLLFLLMTLGPVIAPMPALENARGRIAEWLTVFGRVPFAYYLLHIPLIHLLAVLISVVRTPEATPWLFGDHPLLPGPPPDGYRWSLGLLYAVTALAVFLLYFPCRALADLKARRRDWWLSYL
jgi:uncharacterized membrane protein